MKVVINRRHGGFRLSFEAAMRLAELKGLRVCPMIKQYENGQPRYYLYPPSMKMDGFVYYFLGPGPEYPRWDPEGCERTDPDLVRVVEELGPKANTSVSALKVVEIPDDVNWVIEEEDGLEWVAEVHRTWC